MTRDLHWLMELGVTVEEIAQRTGRTPTAVRAELKADEEKDYDVR